MARLSRCSKDLLVVACCAVESAGYLAVGLEQQSFDPPGCRGLGDLRQVVAAKASGAGAGRTTCRPT